MRCLVADISEDVIMGFNYILPLHGGFATDDAGNYFRLCTSAAPKSPTVNIPLVGQCEAASGRHHRFEEGPIGHSVYTFESDLNPLGPDDEDDPDTDTLSGAPVLLGGRSTTKVRDEAIQLLQYAKDNPHMVTQVEWLVHEDMTPKPALFPEGTSLHSAPAPDPPGPTRRGSMAGSSGEVPGGV
jgi:hypothetical protein